MVNFTYGIQQTDRGWFQFITDGMIIGAYPTISGAFEEMTAFAFNMSSSLHHLSLPQAWTS